MKISCSTFQIPNVFVVTQYFPNTDIEPVVSVFNNEESANKYAEWLEQEKKVYCIDECNVYSKVTITE